MTYTDFTPGQAIRPKQVVALGLDDGSCPVGIVLHDGTTTDTVCLAQYHWGALVFSAGERIVRRSDIAQALFADNVFGSDSILCVWEMDPLENFQRDWKRSHASQPERRRNPRAVRDALRAIDDLEKKS